jgi:homoprotocatechuate degradation regulator HpaR
MGSALPASSRPLADPLAFADDPVHRNLPLLLLQVRERVIARFRPILNEYGVTEQQYRILRAIEMSGPLEPRQICATCHISSPSLAGVLARMDAMGLVARERLAHDQRRLLVSLTPASRSLFRRMRPRIDAVYKGLEADAGRELTADLYRTLHGLLERLALPDEETSDE